MSTEKFTCEGCKNEFNIKDCGSIPENFPIVLCEECYEDALHEAEKEAKKIFNIRGVV